MNRLHYFCTVARAGSLVKASELLNISQPALSKAIKTLEHELDKKLIISSGRGIAITDYGKKLVEEATPIIEKVHDLKFLGVKDSIKGKVNISTFEVFSTYFLGKVISEVFKDHFVSVNELTPGPLEESIITGRSDIGITYLPIPNPEIDILKITTIEMGIFGLKNKFNKVDFSLLPFVIPNIPITGTPSKAKGLDGWPDHKVPRNICYKVAMMETAFELCRQGLCVGYFPNFVIHLHNQYTTQKFKLVQYPSQLSTKYQKQDVYMIKRKSDIESPSFKKISRALRMLG